MNFQRRKLTDLLVYENNPRDNTDAVSKVKESIMRYGYKVPIVIDSSNIIVAGHTRFAALLQINEATGRFEEISVVMADDLDPEELREFRIVDNQVAALSKWDFTKLQIELSSLEDFCLDDFGIIPGFDTDLHLAPETMADDDESGVKFSFGSEKFTMTETEYHAWCSWILDTQGCSVLEYVRNQLHIDPSTRTYRTREI